MAKNNKPKIVEIVKLRIEQMVAKAMPKLCYALRLSRQKELAQDFSNHGADAWRGNTPTIAKRHDLLSTDADDERATGGKPLTEKAVQTQEAAGSRNRL